MTILFVVLTAVMTYNTINFVELGKYGWALFSFALAIYDAVILSGLLSHG